MRRTTYRRRKEAVNCKVGSLDERGRRFPASLLLSLHIHLSYPFIYKQNLLNNSRIVHSIKHVFEKKIYVYEMDLKVYRLKNILLKSGKVLCYVTKELNSIVTSEC